MTFRRILALLKLNFAEYGSNERLYQNKVYTIFVKYLREAGGKCFVAIVVLVVVLVSSCIWGQFSLSISSKNIRKPLVSRSSQGI